jgi:hypothetical protein
MQIEPEAIYGLFDTLYLPSDSTQDVGVLLKEESITNLPIESVNESLKEGVFMFFDREMSEEERDFLNKILAAIQISSNDINMVFDANAYKMLDLIKGIKGTCIIWGIEFNHLEKYTPKKGKNALVILTDPLSDIKDNPILKSKLWNCLKEVFVSKLD